MDSRLSLCCGMTSTIVFARSLHIYELSGLSESGWYFLHCVFSTNGKDTIGTIFEYMFCSVPQKGCFVESIISR